MAVDVLVMPLWRFKVGDFETGLERLAGGTQKLSYIFLDGSVAGPKKIAGFFARRRARRDVDQIRRAVADANGCDVRWHDDGDVAYNAQLHDHTPLTDFVWWLDRRDLLPELPQRKTDEQRRNFYNTARDRASEFPHLSAMPFHTGYALPCDFSRPVEVEPYTIFDTWRGAWKVVSALRLRAELDRVNEVLHAPPGYQWRDDDPLATEKVTYNRIREIVEISCTRGLPAIFWG